MKRRVVVTGMGLVSPMGHQVEECWKRVAEGESGVSLVTLVDMDSIKVLIGGDIKDFDPTGYIEPRDVKRIDRFSQFTMVAAIDAVKDSGIADLPKKESIGVVIGSGIGGLTTISEAMTRLVLKGPDRVSPMTIPKLMLNAGGGNVAIAYGFRGPNYAVATACASATNAMGNAFSHIQQGVADVIVTGGAEAAITRMGISAFQNMKALSRRNDDPQGASRPFDLNRDGFVFSEGAGILVFEELEHAKARGAKIYSEVIGFGTTCDAGHITSPDEHGVGATSAMRAAIQDAQIAPEQIDYINAHGTSTPLGDKAETKAVKNVFGDHAYKLAISSTKSQMGHSLGASGGLEAIFTSCALRDGVVPPTINLETPDPDCDLDYTPNVSKERKLTYAMSNSFGFGGHNASIILKSFEG